MLTIDQSNTVSDLTAVASFYYFPGVTEEIKGYDLASQVERCIEAVPNSEQHRLRPLVTAAIIDPTNNRTSLFEYLAEHTEDEIPDDVDRVVAR